jgi:hypothetical protein
VCSERRKFIVINVDAAVLYHFYIDHTEGNTTLICSTSNITLYVGIPSQTSPELEDLEVVCTNFDTGEVLVVRNSGTE